MDYRDAQWCVKGTWIGFNMKNFAKQAVAHHIYGFFDDGLLEMVKLLSVAHQHFRKQNF